MNQSSRITIFKCTFSKVNVIFRTACLNCDENRSAFKHERKTRNNMNAVKPLLALFLCVCLIVLFILVRVCENEVYTNGC